MKNLWDGEKFFQVEDHAEAERLIKEDKAQDCELEFDRLKFRRDFTGYQTREIRASKPPAPAPAEIVQDEPQEKANWEDYKEDAKKALGLKRINKEKVIEWMSDNGIIAE